jgi:hypothetical protein
MNMMFLLRKVGVCLVALVFLSLSGATSFAQSDNGRVFGTVTDPTGAIIPGANISLTNTETGEHRNRSGADADLRRRRDVYVSKRAAGQLHH